MDETTFDFYMIAIGGTGMAPLACLLKELGHDVRGSDGPLYPPMSTLLADAGIEPLEGYDVGHLTNRPDLIVVGNAVPRDNPEVRAAERRGLPRLSMPQALARFFLGDRQPLVVAGTHGKTTTTALAAWVYSACGADPGYLVGGVPQNLERSFAIGTGERFVVEGDEYNAAYFDRGPKFLHYRPQTLILTSVEYDHADLYPDHETLLSAYRELVGLLPEDGLLIACGDSPEVREIAAECQAKVVFYGLGKDNDVRPVGAIEQGPEGCSWKVADGKSKYTLRLRMPGEHNVANALAVWTAARHDGLPARKIAGAMKAFRGVRRRLEELPDSGDVTVVDDFAHHPTAVGKSLAGLRGRYPERRLIALFEPRSLTAGRAFLFDAYREAFATADAVWFAPIFHRLRLADDERLDLERLATQLEESGVEAKVTESVDELMALARAEARPGDVLVAMSSGSFESLPQRLAAAFNGG